MLRRIIWLTLGALLLLTTSPMLAAELLVDSANLDLLKASAKCDPGSRYKENLTAWVYPPIECPENHFLLARAYDFYQAALALAPDSDRYRERAIELAFARNQLDEAAEELVHFLSSSEPRSPTLKPGSFVFHILRSRVQESSGKIPQAIVETETGLRLSGTRWADESKRAETIRLAELYAEMAQFAAGGQLADAWYQAGLYAGCVANWSGASSFMKNALATEMQAHLSPTQTLTAGLIVRLAERSNLDNVGTQNEYQKQPYLWLGDRLQEPSPDLCWRGALAVYQRDPQNGQSAFAAARILLNHVGWKEAREYYLLAAEREPQNAEIAFELGYTTRELGDGQGSVPWLKRAFEIAPKAVYAVRLAQSYHGLKQAEQALFYADLSMELPPEDDWVRFWAGRIYAENGQYDKARQAVQEAVSMNPKNEEARNLLVVLASR